ncbi:hypothetical protein L226DRAFT_166211 [Lentinus tigrinus ALCF2SS1-7]|uniref:uncharacterized protein n=1 Tax=Lentinus tigrinus ALCF2SS1-7 TaxID=1328758 RepID=UPI001165E36A|nr:hypothetical protein L226DRAFT_166211 [Lentinus tigrinus ALCF2SS1-7]
MHASSIPHPRRSVAAHCPGYGLRLLEFLFHSEVPGERRPLTRPLLAPRTSSPKSCDFRPLSRQPPPETGLTSSLIAMKPSNQIPQDIPVVVACLPRQAH